MFRTTRVVEEATPVLREAIAAPRVERCLQFSFHEKLSRWPVGHDGSEQRRRAAVHASTLSRPDRRASCARN